MSGIIRNLSKKVITLNDDTLRSSLSALWVRIGSELGYPDCIIGIAEGGLYCAEIMSELTGAPTYSVRLTRPTTEIKKRSFNGRIIGMMPYLISNPMRRLEDAWLSLREEKASAGGRLRDTPCLQIDAEKIGAVVRAKKFRHLVVIDDAVDSGVTLASVVSALRASVPDGTKVSTAVITQSRTNPRIVPDIALFKKCLCRFPWSLDFRG